jgi:hypothetical protein
MTENSKTAAQAEYKRVIIAFHDLSDCRLYLNRLTGRNGETPPGPDDRAQRNALMTAIVVSYARPFSGNRSAEDVARRLPPAFIQALTGEELALHKRVLKLRNREFAHSDPDVSQVKVTVSAVASGESLAMPLSNVPRQGLSIEELDRLDGLCAKLHMYLHDSMLKLQETFEPGDTF